MRSLVVAVYRVAMIRCCSSADFHPSTARGRRFTRGRDVSRITAVSDRDSSTTPSPSPLSAFSSPFSCSQAPLCCGVCGRLRMCSTCSVSRYSRTVKDRANKATPVHPSKATSFLLEKRPEPPEEWVASAWKTRRIRAGKAPPPVRASKATWGSAQALRWSAGGFLKLLPSMTTVWAWCSSRSMAADAMRSSRNSGYHSSRARLLVRMIDPRS